MNNDLISKRVTLAVAVSLACAIGFAGIALLIGANKIAAFDSRLIAFIQGLENEPLTNVMKFFTWIGTGLPVAVISLIAAIFLYTVLGHRRELVLLMIVVVGTGLLNYTLKVWFHRDRPTIYRIAEANGFSFPSGHSMLAFSLYGIIAYLLWKHIPRKAGRIALIVASTSFILMIGISRIYLGVHYPSDVIGGYLASGSLMFALIWCYDRYGRKSAVAYSAQS
ncbi:phosphatase PAP2 family protein [Paenibacillus mesophilus]|uniref:phosphatase PAP2 family protein n=1 Tax=Paenibacillus mesophilus TaxID=2582849 RepID=UPI001EE4AD50|nr:phosphatase PAP2 family protein [Paenibacillus mesophilus]